MKLHTLSLVVAGCLLSGIASAKVQLNVDENIRVTAINGKEVRQGLLQPLRNEFELEAGQHVITARYDRLFTLNNDHDYLKSGNITLAADLADNQTYQLVMPNQPNNYAAAKEYIKSPSLAITHNGQIIARQDDSEERTGLITNLANSLGGMLRPQGAVASNQATIAAIQQQSANTNSATAAPDLGNFQKLWESANEEERAKILKWIGQQAQ